MTDSMTGDQNMWSKIATTFDKNGGCSWRGEKNNEISYVYKSERERNERRYL